MLHYSPTLQISMQWYSERTFSSVITAKYLQTPCCHRFTELFNGSELHSKSTRTWPSRHRLPEALQVKYSVVHVIK